MATVQGADQDSVIPMTDAEHRDLIAKGTSYAEMTAAQRRSYDKRAAIHHELMTAEYRERNKEHLDRIKGLDLSGTFEEFLERIRPKHAKGSPQDVLHQDVVNGESAVDSVRRVRGTL